MRPRPRPLAQTEQHVLGADVGVAELKRLSQGELKDLLGARREGRGPRRGRPRHPDRLFNFLAHRLQGDSHRVKGFGGDAFPFVDETQQDVLRPDEAVIEQPGLFLSQDQHPPGSVCKALEQLPASVPRPRKASVPVRCAR